MHAIHALQQVGLVLVFSASGCGPRVHAQPQPACHVAPVVPCTTSGRSGDVVRGHVAIGVTICSDRIGGGCSATYIVTDDKSLGIVTLRGPELGCRGPEEAMCCPIDALHREVVAYGTLGHDDRHQWIDVTELCAP